MVFISNETNTTFEHNDTAANAASCIKWDKVANTKLAIRLESDKLPEPIDILHEAAKYAVL